MPKNDGIDPRILTGGVHLPAETLFTINVCKWLLIASLLAVAFLGWPALIVSATSLFGLFWTVRSILSHTH